MLATDPHAYYDWTPRHEPINARAGAFKTRADNRSPSMHYGLRGQGGGTTRNPPFLRRRPDISRVEVEMWTSFPFSPSHSCGPSTTSPLAGGVSHQIKASTMKGSRSPSTPAMRTPLHQKYAGESRKMEELTQLMVRILTPCPLMSRNKAE